MQRKTLLRHLRRERELSLDLLAKRSRVNVSTISRAERGLLTPSAESMERLARFFNVDPADLLKPYTPQQVAQ
jgi:transcriptional regulator with XRE-family HTH domain